MTNCFEMTKYGAVSRFFFIHMLGESLEHVRVTNLKMMSHQINTTRARAFNTVCCLTKVLFSSDGLVRGKMCPGAGPLSSDAPCSRAALFLAFSRTVGSSGMSPCVPLPFPYPRPSLLLGQPHVEEKRFLFFPPSLSLIAASIYVLNAGHFCAPKHLLI